MSFENLVNKLILNSFVQHSRFVICITFNPIFDHNYKEIILDVERIYFRKYSRNLKI